MIPIHLNQYLKVLKWLDGEKSFLSNKLIESKSGRILLVQIADVEYQGHRVFSELDRYANFYKKLSMSVFSFPIMGTNAIANIDTYVYSSMQGTVESIRVILLQGRINDAFALLRKYYDSAMINVYSNLYLKNNFSIDNFVVEKIHNWLQGKEKLPEYRIMSKYIRDSERFKQINELLYKDGRYKSLRDRCNDHAHYNFFHNLMLNDNEIYIKNRGKTLDQFTEDVRDIFVLHLAYIFILNEHYMMSSDHLDALECNMEPEDGSQYWVASFIQDIFNTVVTPSRPDITASIKVSSAMHLS
jgi:hypothetical protein